MSKRRTNKNWRDRDSKMTFMPPKITKPIKKKRMLRHYLKLEQQRLEQQGQ